MLKWGVVYEVGTGDKRGRVRVRFPDMDDLVSWWLFVSATRTGLASVYWMPAVGESVACVLDQEMEDGIVLGSHFNAQDPPPGCPMGSLHVEFGDGSWLEYDPAGPGLVASFMGTVDLRAVGKVRVQSMDGLEFSGAGPVKLSAMDNMTVTASGKLTIEAYDNVEVKAYAAATISAAESVLVVAPAICLQGGVSIDGGLDVKGPTAFIGAVDVKGTFSADKSSATHTHPVAAGTAQLGAR